MHFSSKLFSSSCGVNRLRLFLSHPSVQHQTKQLYSITSAAERRNDGSMKKENFDILGTWDSRVELPLELESSINLGTPIPKILVSAIGSHSMQGRL